MQKNFPIPKTAAGRLELGSQLFTSGMLCDCDNWQVAVAINPEDEPDMIQEVLIHKNNCDGVTACMEIIYSVGDEE